MNYTKKFIGILLNLVLVSHIFCGEDALKKHVNMLLQGFDALMENTNKTPEDLVKELKGSCTKEQAAIIKEASERIALGYGSTMLSIIGFNCDKSPEEVAEVLKKSFSSKRIPSLEHILEIQKHIKHGVINALSNSTEATNIQNLIYKSNDPHELAEKMKDIVKKDKNVSMYDLYKILKEHEKTVGYEKELVLGKYKFETPVLNSSLKGDVPEPFKIAIDKIKNPEKYTANYREGILMKGLPGTGKTEWAHQFAALIGADILKVNAADVLNKYMGESENKVEQIFESVIHRAKGGKKIVLFFDEIDAFTRSREDKASKNTASILTKFLTLVTDTLKSTNNIYIIAATNVGKILDPAVTRPERLGTIITFGYPTRDARREIITGYLPQELHTKIDIEKLVSNTTNFTPADLKQLVAKTIESCTYHGTEVTTAAFIKVLTSIVREKNKIKIQKDSQN